MIKDSLIEKIKCLVFKTANYKKQNKILTSFILKKSHYIAADTVKSPYVFLFVYYRSVIAMSRKGKYMNI